MQMMCILKLRLLTLHADHLHNVQPTPHRVLVCSCCTQIPMRQFWLHACAIPFCSLLLSSIL